MDTSLWSLVWAPAVVFVAAFAGVRSMVVLGRIRGWTAAPQKDRWHKKPVALHGGVGFCPPFLAAVAVLLYVGYFGSLPEELSLEAVPAGLKLGAAILLGTTGMFVCGLWDDIRGMKPVTKLIFQVGAASLFVYMGGYFPLTGRPVIDLLVTYIWFVGITNSVNLLDNMDGLSSGIVFIAAVSAAVMMYAGGALHTPAFGMCLYLCAGLFAFWLHNKRPASIFMGDSGSLAVGYCIAAISLPGPLNNFFGISPSAGLERELMVLFIPAALLVVPIFDTTFVTLTRLLRAQSVSRGGCDHISHRLVRLGFSESRAVHMLYGLGVFGGMLALATMYSPNSALPVFGLLIPAVALFGAYLRSVAGATEEKEARSSILTVFIKDFLLRRNLPQVLLDTVLIVTCFWGAYLLRFDFSLDPVLRDAMLQALPLVTAACLLGLRLAGAYGGSWRMASLMDVPVYAFGSFLGTVLSLAVAVIFSRFGEGYSRSAYIIFGFLLFLALTFSRQSFRLLDSAVKRRTADSRKSDRIPVIIYGAGKGGKILYEEIIHNPAYADYKPAVFVDDDPALNGHKVFGLPVKSNNAHFEFADKVPEIWISSPKISDRQALDLAERFHVPVELRRLDVRIKDISSPAGRKRIDRSACDV